MPEDFAESNLTFELSGVESLRLTKEWNAVANPANRYLPFIVAIPALVNGIGPLVIFAREADRSTVVTTAYVVAAVAAAAIVALLVVPLSRFLRERKRVYEIAVDFASDWIAFTQNGDAQRVRWYAIEDAVNVRDAIALSRRDTRAPIIIPKRVLAGDGTQLWAYLERKLTGTLPEARPLSFTAPKRIANSIDRFVSLRAAR